MTAARRWCIVAVGIAVLVALPTAIRALPARDSALSASTLLQRVQGSGGVAYSGYAEAVGGLQLPVTDEFSDLANLLGERTRLRVWWRGDDDWRVDALEPSGETDLIHDERGTTVWEYEAARVTRTSDPAVRLPRTADLLPSVLGRWLLSEASAREVSRLPAERVAGRDAPGLRLDPADPQSSVDHVDVWVDARTGLPLRVAVYGPAEDTAAMTTSFLELSTEAPGAADTAFTRPPGAEFDVEETLDIATRADRFAPVLPPDRLAGLQRRSGDRGGAVGDYGRGVTRLVAIPLWDEPAGPLRDQLARTPGVEVDDVGTTVTIGVLGLLLADRNRDGTSWLLAGTVTTSTLRQAATELAALAGARR